MQKQELRGRAIYRDVLLNREKALQQKTQITFSLTYYLVFKKVRKILEGLHLLVSPDQAHNKVFSEVPIISFKNFRSLKDHLVTAVSPQFGRESRSKPYEGQIVHVKFESQLKIKQNLKKQR